MNKTVHKFTLRPDHGYASVIMPEGAQVLSVGFQRRDLRLWALVDEGAPMVARTFFVCLTGRSLPEGEWGLIGRGETPDPYVAHVFEEIANG